MPPFVEVDGYTRRQGEAPDRAGHRGDPRDGAVPQEVRRQGRPGAVRKGRKVERREQNVKRLAVMLLLQACAVVAQALPPAEQDFRIGASLLHDNTGVTAEMMLLQPVTNTGLALQVGGGIWSPTRNTSLNWDWSGGVRSCWDFGLCFFIGGDFLQKIDHMNGAHTNWLWSFSYTLDKDPAHMFKGIAQWHISNAGTSDTNIGRNAIGVEFRCQHEIIICLP